MINAIIFLDSDSSIKFILRMYLRFKWRHSISFPKFPRHYRIFSLIANKKKVFPWLRCCEYTMGFIMLCKDLTIIIYIYGHKTGSILLVEHIYWSFQSTKWDMDYIDVQGYASEMIALITILIHLDNVINLYQHCTSNILFSSYFLLNKLFNTPLSKRSSSFLAPGISMSVSFLR